MQNYQKLKGLVAATFTPMHANGDINYAVIDRYAQHIVNADIGGVFVCGTTGEFSSLTTEERKKILEQWVKAAGGRFRVIAHVGGDCQRDAMELSAHAAEAGADAIASIAPSFFKPAAVQELIGFLRPVAAAAPSLPFYYYNMPSMTGVTLSVTTFLLEGIREIPTLAGVKYTHNNMMEMSECIHLEGGAFEVLHGFDETLICGLALGAVAGVGSTYNYLPSVYFRLDFTQPVFWVVLIGGVANSLITYTSDQSVVQRYMSTKDEKATSRSIWLNGILSIPVTLLFFLIGTGLFAFYKDNAAQMMVDNPNIDSVFPQFIVTEMPAGLAGLLIAAVFAAAMSTLSSNINSSAAVITSDFFRTLSKRSTFTSQMQVARWSGLLCGLLGMGMALVLATWNIASLWDQFNTFLGLLTSGLGAIFILGIFFPRVGSKAALTGVIAGLFVLLLVKTNTPLSFLLYGFIGMTASIIIALVFSFLFPNRKEIGDFTWDGIKREK